MEARPPSIWHKPWLRRACVAMLAALIAILSWQAYGAWLFSGVAHVG